MKCHLRVVEEQWMRPARATDPSSLIMRFRKVRVGTSVGSEKSVPEEVNHSEIAVCVQVVDEMKLLLAPEPSEVCKARSFGVVFLVKIDVCAERRHAGGGHHDK
jgi:hypothetical protein